MLRTSPTGTVSTIPRRRIRRLKMKARRMKILPVMSCLSIGPLSTRTKPTTTMVPMKALMMMAMTAKILVITIKTIMTTMMMSKVMLLMTMTTRMMASMITKMMMTIVMIMTTMLRK